MQIARHVGEPLGAQFGLPPNTNYDQLLCAVYQRAFFGYVEAPAGANPFATAPPTHQPRQAAVFVPENGSDTSLTASWLAGVPVRPSSSTFCMVTRGKLA